MSESSWKAAMSATVFSQVPARYEALLGGMYKGEKIFLPSSRRARPVISSLHRILRVSFRVVTRLSPPLPCSNYLPSSPVSFSLCPRVAFRPCKSDAVRTKFINPPCRAVESPRSVSTLSVARGRGSHSSACTGSTHTYRA